jgi:SAM-dependent methyltransferase
MSGVRKLARSAVWPVRRLLDPRFADVARRIEYTGNRVVDESRQIEARQAELSDLIGTFGAASNESLAFLGRQIREFEGALSDLTGRLQAIEDVMGPLMHGRRMQAIAAGGIDRLDGDTAGLLNFAESHRGFAAQRHLWTNPPLSLQYLEGDVRLGSVNERIVEIPYAFRALGALRPPAAILDVGSVESTIPLSLAALGYSVCALDLRPYPYEHPNLEVAVSRLEDFEREPGSFDAILCISTVEHVGLGWYGEAPQAADADRRAIERLGELLKPEGLLVLTVPFGRAGVDDVQRTYDETTLDALVEGWRVESREIVRQRDDRTWVLGEQQDPSARAVAMVTAVRPS